MCHPLCASRATCTAAASCRMLSNYTYSCGPNTFATASMDGYIAFASKRQGNAQRNPNHPQRWPLTNWDTFCMTPPTVTIELSIWFCCPKYAVTRPPTPAPRAPCKRRIKSLALCSRNVIRETANSDTRQDPACNTVERKYAYRHGGIPCQSRRSHTRLTQVPSLDHIE